MARGMQISDLQAKIDWSVHYNHLSDRSKIEQCSKLNPLPGFGQRQSSARHPVCPSVSETLYEVRALTFAFDRPEHGAIFGNESVESIHLRLVSVIPTVIPHRRSFYHSGGPGLST